MVLRGLIFHGDSVGNGLYCVLTSYKTCEVMHGAVMEYYLDQLMLIYDYNIDHHIDNEVGQK